MSLPGDFVDVGGMRVFVHRAGSGPPLLLLHGFLLDHWGWRGVMPALAERFTVFAPDLPGFGESDRPLDFPYDFCAYADVVDALGEALALPRVALVGHSMGGGVALTAAVRHPERVARLVLCDSACYPAPLPLEGRLALTPGLGAFIFKRLYRKADLARYFRTSVFADHPALADEQYIDHYWERLERPAGREAAHRALHGLSQVDDLAERPRRVGCPALVVWGERDRIFPAAHGERLARELPHGSLAVVAGAGHAVPEERPADFTRLVTDFLTAGVTRGRWAGRPAA